MYISTFTLKLSFVGKAEKVRIKPGCRFSHRLLLMVLLCSLVLTKKSNIHTHTYFRKSTLYEMCWNNVAFNSNSISSVSLYGALIGKLKYIILAFRFFAVLINF